MRCVWCKCCHDKDTVCDRSSMKAETFRLHWLIQSLEQQLAEAKLPDAVQAVVDAAIVFVETTDNMGHSAAFVFEYRNFEKIVDDFKALTEIKE